MSDVSGIDGIDWNGPITIIVTGGVTVAVEYLRRKMPKDRHNRRKDDDENRDIDGTHIEDREDDV